jgi:hypothetical protein
MVKGPKPLNLDTELYTLVVISSSCIGENVIAIMSYICIFVFTLYLYLEFCFKKLVSEIPTMEKITGNSCLLAM